MVLESRRLWDIFMLFLLIGAIASSRAFWFNPEGLSRIDDSLILKPGETLPSPDPRVFKSLDRLVVATIKTRSRDHLWNLAKAYGTTWDSIRSTNRLDSTSLRPGQSITIHNHKGMMVQVGAKGLKARTLQDLARHFGQDATAIAAANELPGVSLLTGELPQGQEIFIPNVLLRFPDYIFPVGWGRISSGFGSRLHPILGVRRHHSGIDMPRPYGTPVRASREGRVTFTGWNGGYGLLVVIRHSDGITTWYGHLSKISAAVGDWIKQKQVIGNVGSTGLSTGPHLHFEVRSRAGNPLNPRRYLK